jgi:superfamily II RNA helicase
VLAEYLSPTELLEMVVYAYGEEMYDSDAYNVNTVDRYYVMYNALISKADTLLVEVMNGVRKDYTLDINGDLRMAEYTELAKGIFEANTAALEQYMDDFVALVQWLKEELDKVVALRRFGDKNMSEHREVLFDVLRDFLNIGRELPTHAALVEVLEGLLDVCHWLEVEEWKLNSYEDLFETYLEYGQVNW